MTAGVFVRTIYPPTIIVLILMTCHTTVHKIYVFFKTAYMFYCFRSPQKKKKKSSHKRRSKNNERRFASGNGKISSDHTKRTGKPLPDGIDRWGQGLPPEVLLHIFQYVVTQEGALPFLIRYKITTF